MKETTRRFYLIVLLLSLISLVFYLGFLYGLREKYNGEPSQTDIQNPNGQKITSISKVLQKQVKGSGDSKTVVTFGLLYYLINDKNQTEIKINLEGVPASIKQTQGQSQIAIPDTLRIDTARRVRDSQGRDDYIYENISTNPNVLATITLQPGDKGLRNGTFDGFINSPLVDPTGTKSNVERIVLRPVDAEIKNIYIDPDPDLPILIRGNEPAKIIGQPAPFFWVKF